MCEQRRHNAAVRRGAVWSVRTSITRHKYTTITVKTYKTEGILEGESLHIGVLGVGGRHSDAMERATMPRLAECSCSVDIEFIAF